jgi:hypothetical protein
VALCWAIATAGGCATKGRTGALAGGGVGALIGQVAGRSTEATLVGAAVGTGIGYIIGNEMDKKEAKALEAQNKVPDNGQLAGTSWKVISLVRDEPLPHQSIILEFRRDGRVITTRILPDGNVVRADEAYRVVGSTLIVNKPGYIVNATYRIDGREMIVETPKARAVLERV